jgi:two-component system, NtrC family, sensor kinase
MGVPIDSISSPLEEGLARFSPDEPRDTHISADESLSEKAQKALRERPSVSIRIRVILGLFLIFILTGATTTTSWIVFSKIQTKLDFLETVDTFRFEIQQARRYEKNFFLYGTNLTDALENIQGARALLLDNVEKIREVIGSLTYQALVDHLDKYQSLLGTLLKSPERDTSESYNKQLTEAELRNHGAELNAMAMRLTEKERQAVHKMLAISKRIPLVFLAFFFLPMIYLANFFIQQILRPLTRFMDYTQRISQGDFSPIQPARRYKDEFSNLAIAFNQMLDQLKKHQEQLLQSRKMAAIGNLTSGIAHELNNPLNNIGITTEALLDDLDSLHKETIKKMLEDIYAQTERASSTVKNLLDFTRVEQPSFVPISVKELLAATIRLVKNEIDMHNIQLEIDLPKDFKMIHGDFVQLQQVFVNLMLNSIQAMEGGGTLTVAAQKVDRDSIRIDVIDTGIGIPASHVSQIFDPFFTTKEVGKGTGLGLTVSYSIIKKHQGTISVRSEVHRGTTFSVYLPAAENKNA